MADKLESDAERINEANRRQRGPVAGQATDLKRLTDGLLIGTAVGAIEAGQPVVAAAPLQPAPPPPPSGPSLYARRVRAELEARRAAKQNPTENPQDERTDQ